MKLHCAKCDNTVEVTKFTIKVVNGKLVKSESICNCGEQMQDISEYDGLGGIIKKPGGTVARKFNSNRYS
jgi:hypothetical protein